MADSFANGGGGGFNPRALFTNPWILGAGAVALVLGIVVWRRTSGNRSLASVGNQVPANGGIGVQPGASGAAVTTDQLGLEIGGIQGQLSNLIQQVSGGAAQQGGTVSPSSFSSVSLVARPGYNQNLVELWGSPGTDKPVLALPGGPGGKGGTTLQSAGSLVEGQFFSEAQYPGGSSFWQPVTYQGQKYYVWAPDALASNP